MILWFRKTMTYVTKEMKVILESVHLILTSVNLSEKLLLKSRQCSVCYYASKDTLFSAFTKEVFFCHLLMAALCLSALGTAVGCGGDQEPALMGLTFCEMREQKLSEQKTK